MAVEMLRGPDHIAILMGAILIGAILIEVFPVGSGMEVFRDRVRLFCWTMFHRAGMEWKAVLDTGKGRAFLDFARRPSVACYRMAFQTAGP